MLIFVYKINLKKSKIPKTLKLPKYVYPNYAENKKPSPFFHQKIDIKNTEFLLKIEKGKDFYSFAQLDPFPQVWTRGVLNLFRNKEFKELFQAQEDDGIFLERQSYNISKLTYDELDKSLLNHTNHYAGKNNKKLKKYGETHVHFDFIKEVETDNIIDAFPSKVRKNLNLKNLQKSHEILKKKPVASKEFFGKRIFSYQQVSSSYDLYDIKILAKKLQELKFYVLPENVSYTDKKNFFLFFNQYYVLSQRILGYDKDVVKILVDITNHLSFDEDNKKFSKNLLFYSDLIDEHWKSENK